MDFTLTEPERELLDLGRTYAEREIAPIAARAWHEEQCPTDVLRGLGKLGLLGLLVPERWGGIGASTVGFVSLVEAIAAIDPSIAAAFQAHSTIGTMPLLLFGSDDQRERAVKISASVMTSDPWTETDQVQPDVNTLTRNAANEAYETAGVDPSDLDLVELHDCFATAELIHYDNLGLCKPGEAGKFIEERGPWRDGETPVNVSGGLISKGHPLGATGVANLY